MSPDVQWNLIGYARVSTDDQNLDTQRAALIRAGVHHGKIYEEKVSGASNKRPELLECLKVLGPGDVLVIWKLDRLGRDLANLIRLANQIAEQGAQLRSLTEAIDTTTAYGTLFFNIIGAFSQFERDLISERTRARMQHLKDEGRILGRRPAISPEQWAYLGELLIEDPDISLPKIRQHKGFLARGWDGAKTKPPGQTSVSTARARILAGEPYPPEWQQYVDRERTGKGRKAP
jgi:DNA invertase Pin-like site-specific DNA recombinase